jgi:hypothetical protein
MKIEQKRWTKASGWEIHPASKKLDKVDLVLLFTSRDQMSQPSTFRELRKSYPTAVLLGCTTAGEIYNTQVTDESVVYTAIQFEHTQLRAVSLPIAHMDQSYKVGQKLAETLDQPGLQHVLVLSDGVKVNGSNLVVGMREHLSKNISITGGLAGDADRFEKTFVLSNDGVHPDYVAAVGFYGNRLKIGCSSLGGWDPFGPERIVTKSKDNILYELDGQSALELYKKYLGALAEKLPSSGLLFPLTIRSSDKDEWLVRTLLSVDEDEKAMIFAGNIPQGAHARLMRANMERLIQGANGAAMSIKEVQKTNPEFALLISCVGRKMILKQRVEEEVEAVQEIFGADTIMTGFYSYGEISPHAPNAKCELHNQTMTITTFSEL